MKQKPFFSSIYYTEPPPPPWFSKQIFVAPKYKILNSVFAKMQFCSEYFEANEPDCYSL